MTYGTDSEFMPDLGAPRGPVRVVVVDRRSLIADAIARIVSAGAGFEVVTTVSGEPSAPAIAGDAPDLVLIGVGADHRAALGLVASLVSQIGGAPIVLIADTVRPELVSCVLAHCLGGLLLTDHPSADLVASLRHIARGRAVLPAGWQRQLDRGAADPLGVLSARQLEVLRLLAEGCSYGEIGARLFISVNTVKFHMRSIFDRLGVRNRMAAVRVLSDAGGS